MLSDRNIERINDQIETELRKLNSIIYNEKEKDEAVKRISQLNALLTEQPTREEIVNDVVAILTEQKTVKTPERPASLIDVLFGFHR